jgi:hypothetical protein
VEVVVVVAGEESAVLTTAAREADGAAADAEAESLTVEPVASVDGPRAATALKVGAFLVLWRVRLATECNGVATALRPACQLPPLQTFATAGALARTPLSAAMLALAKAKVIGHDVGKATRQASHLLLPPPP